MAGKIIVPSKYRRVSPLTCREEDCGHGTPCWIWQGALGVGGYGALHREGRTQRAHRWMYKQFVGPIPEGAELDHLCRVRACVNPAHLEPISRAENVRRGLKTKLTRADVLQIRSRLVTGASYHDLAREFGVSTDTISNIRTGKTWKDVSCPAK